MDYLRAIFRMSCLSIVIVSLFLTSKILAFLDQVRLLRLFTNIPINWLLAANKQNHFRFLIRSLGIDHQVSEDLKKPIGKSGSLILSNHVSYLDIILMASIYPLAFLAKTEVRDWPLLGSVTNSLNTIYVDRDRTLSRLQCLYQLKKQIDLNNYCIFPEGTTSDRYKPNLDNWKAGNLALTLNQEIRIIMVGINYQDHKDLSWIDDMTLIPHVWKILKRKKMQARIYIRELDTNEIDRSNLRLSSKKICKAVGSLCSNKATKQPEILPLPLDHCKSRGILAKMRPKSHRYM